MARNPAKRSRSAVDRAAPTYNRLRHLVQLSSLQSLREVLTDMYLENLAIGTLTSNTTRELPSHASDTLSKLPEYAER